MGDFGGTTPNVWSDNNPPPGEDVVTTEEHLHNVTVPLPYTADNANSTNGILLTSGNPGFPVGPAPPK